MARLRGVKHSRSLWALVVAVVAASIVGAFVLIRAQPSRATILNGLRDEINANYGMHNGTPRINCGPCARFAVSFREQWNARFREPVHLVCVLSDDSEECGHVAVKLPDGNLFDGGNGVFTLERLQKIYAGRRIEEMFEFDRERLDRMTGGLEHQSYPLCPNYSQELTDKLIERHLASISSE